MEGNILVYVRLKYPEIADSKLIEYGQFENLNLYWEFDNGIRINESLSSLIDDMLGLILKIK
jgi:hypothetical protein